MTLHDGFAGGVWIIDDVWNLKIGFAALVNTWILQHRMGEKKQYELLQSKKPSTISSMRPTQHKCKKKP